MDRYDSYKASGIEWIGEIPIHWGVCRLKHVTLPLKSGGTPTSGNSSFYCEDGTPWVAIADMSSTDYIEDTDKHLTPLGIEDKNLTIYPVGTILYSIYATLGKVSELKIPATINQAILAIEVKDGVDKGFFKFVLKAQEQYVFSQSNGNTQFNLNAQKVSNFNFIKPPIIEQQAIADWLDKKCGEIDRVIEKQNKRIELLEELKQSLITQAVTRGLNPNVALKKSGIEWIEEIPEHWEVAPMKRYMKFNNGQDYKEFQADEGYPVMGSGGCFAYATKYLYDGEAVLLGRKGTIDKPLYVNEKFWSVDTMFYATPKKDTFVKYMYYVAKTIPFNRYSTATALPSMTQTDLGNHIVAIPPRTEQVNIADYLDTETAKIDAQIAKVNKEIELLQEYKQSIITEVVTGKRKVC